MAEDTRGAGSSQSTIIRINRERSGSDAPPIADWNTGGVTPVAPRGAPWAAISGLIASVGWLGAATAWAAKSMGMAAILALPPIEAAALTAAAFLPVSVIWLIIVALDRGTLMRREADALRRQLALLAYPAEAAEARISTIGESLRAQVRDLSTATREAAGQGEGLRLMLSRETRELARLTDHIDGQTSHALGRVASEVQGLSALMERVSGLAGDMEQALSRRHDALDTVAGRAERSAELLGRTLEGQSRALAETVEAVGDRCATVDALLVRQDAGLSRGRDVAAALEAAATRLDDTTRSVITGLAHRAEVIEQVNATLAERSVGLAESLREAGEVSARLSDDLDERARVFAVRNREITDTSQAAIQELDAATAAALGDFNAFRDVAHETVAGAKAAAAAVHDAATQGETIQHMLHAQAKDLEDAVRTLGAEVRSAGAAVRSETAEVEQVTDKAGDRIRHLADLLSRNAVDITRTTARSVVEIETVSESLRAGVVQVEGARDAVQDAADVLAQENAAARDGLAAVTEAMQAGRRAASEAAEAFAADTDRVADAANSAVTALARVGHDLRAETDDLAGATDGALGRARVLHESLTEVLQAYEAGVNRSTDHLGSAGEQLRISAETFEATAVHASDRLASASDELAGRTRGIEGAATKALTAMDALTAGMDSKTGVLEAVGAKVAANLRAAAGEFARHTEALVAATRTAAQRTKDLETAREKADLHRFLKDTSYAVERLQASAVDITRLFSPSIEDDLWKRFYKGEQNVFLRQAARSLTRSQAAAVRKLFSQNAEFRDYASRYMGEYETLLKAARLSDRADVLTAVFTASDMGRLYTVLAKSTGRTATV